jgi:hypothetical protein
MQRILFVYEPKTAREWSSFGEWQSFQEEAELKKNVKIY